MSRAKEKNEETTRAIQKGLGDSLVRELKPIVLKFEEERYTDLWELIERFGFERMVPIGKWPAYFLWSSGDEFMLSKENEEILRFQWLDTKKVRCYGDLKKRTIKITSNEKNFDCSGPKFAFSKFCVMWQAMPDGEREWEAAMLFSKKHSLAIPEKWYK